jgi:hypothetical protein
VELLLSLWLTLSNDLSSLVMLGVRLCLWIKLISKAYSLIEVLMVKSSPESLNPQKTFGNVSLPNRMDFACSC